jgi:hypothetical protein
MFDRLKRKDFVTTTQGAASPTTNVNSTPDTTKASGSAEPRSRDAFSMRDYITKNQQSFNTEQLNPSIDAKLQQTQKQADELKEQEKESYGKAIANVEKAKAETPTATYGDVMGRPATVDVSSYDKALDSISSTMRDLEGYRTGSGQINYQDTSDIQNAVGTQAGRQELARKQFGSTTPIYTQGMGMLDAALAERSGIDTRGLASQVQNLYNVTTNEQKALENLRNQQSTDRQKALEALSLRGDDIYEGRGRAINELDVRQQTFDKVQQDLARIRAEQEGKARAIKEAEDARIAEEMQREADVKEMENIRQEAVQDVGKVQEQTKDLEDKATKAGTQAKEILPAFDPRNIFKRIFGR